MKHFFIFAAMLLTLNINAYNLEDDPPIVKPEAEQIILIPQDMHDIDRSIAYCGYTYYSDMNMISVTCHRTGSPTVLTLFDGQGNIVDRITLLPEIDPQTTFILDGTENTYILTVESFRYYGEGIIIAE